MRLISWKLVAVVAAIFILPACASSGAGGATGGEATEGATAGATEGATAGTTEGATAGTTEGETSEGGTTEGATTVFIPPVTGEGCQYDVEKKGKIVGKHIKEFGLKQVFGPTKEETDAYWLHANCGEAKAVWIILATGW
jgi:hypothetical protein